ncbi:putative pectinesterase inhibitor domain, Cell wall/vacuolar inhibitor of fructosidase [Rosa chinensis]|uniref:Putative pectinesterase inhibitor domain, Cell wall/vacuolar inhibitor of fructosidase n=1 Tax=Rosa chinensis TaxID=74649 RepID=A0A2P6QZ89_ROSCH|nr:cell wall / vacuolar inhibitor of fructosidase 1 [Rosa chinensis]PRQ39504.1 putative pectinesterase inhibitor domain, Cell wall/vacuolar inhibitor of fructosidase [Rosa chinensis]
MKIISISLPLLTIFIIQNVFLPISHCRADLIDQTCKQTPNYNLCVSSLKSNPRSSAADVKGLAIIMVEVVKSKANDTLNKIWAELLRHEDPVIRNCYDHYGYMVGAFIPDIYGDLTSRGLGGRFVRYNPAQAERRLHNDIILRVDHCQNGFGQGRRSPFAKENKATHEAAVVAAAIVWILI